MSTGKKVSKYLKIILILVVLLLAGAGIAVATLDPNKYRDQLAQALEKKLGRSVTLAGPIGFALSLHGVKLSVADVVVGNPAWASRPALAKIGKIDLALSFPPLLARKIVVTQFLVSDADIQLETRADDQHNWDMKTETVASSDKATPATSTEGNVAVLVNKVAIENSTLSVRDKNGKISVYKLSDVTLHMEGGRAKWHVVAAVDGAPVTADVTVEMDNLLAKGPWPLEAEIGYAAYHLHLLGRVDAEKKQADFKAYQIDAGSSQVEGHFTAQWGGVQPEVTGTVESAHLAPDDFKPESKATTSSASASSEVQSPYVLSDKPLALAGLKKANLLFDVKLKEVVIGESSLKDVQGRVTLKNGVLDIPSWQALIGGQPLKGAVRFNAATAPAQFSLNFGGTGVDLGDLLHLAGKPAFVSGKGNADIRLSGAGDSLHELASHLNGTVLVTAEGGQVDAGLVGQASTALLGLVMGGGSANPQLRCLAARFIVVNGVAKDNGLLADATVSTLFGAGGVDFRNETLDLNLKAQAGTGKVGSLIPPVHVTGTFRAPSYGTDAAGAVQNVLGLLSKGKVSSGVPVLMVAPAGQNACVYTLDHRAATVGEPVGFLSPDPVSKVKDQIQNLGGGLIKGLLGP